MQHPLCLGGQRNPQRVVIFAYVTIGARRDHLHRVRVDRDVTRPETLHCVAEVERLTVAHLPEGPGDPSDFHAAPAMVKGVQQSWTCSVLPLSPGRSE